MTGICFVFIIGYKVTLFFAYTQARARFSLFFLYFFAYLKLFYSLCDVREKIGFLYVKKVIVELDFHTSNPLISINMRTF